MECYKNTTQLLDQVSLTPTLRSEAKWLDQYNNTPQKENGNFLLFEESRLKNVPVLYNFYTSKCTYSLNIKSNLVSTKGVDIFKFQKRVGMAERALIFYIK